ncbi:hypothetical protein ACHAQA_009791 [Verticillium albo-atrum]
MSGDYTILDARALNAAQIADFNSRIPLTPEQKGYYRDIDGSGVKSHKDLYHPAPGILQEKPTEEQKAETRRAIEARKAELEQQFPGGACCLRRPEGSIEDRRAEVQREIEERNALLEEENPTMPCCKQP